MSFSAAAPITSTFWPGARRIVTSPAAWTESVVFRTPGLPPMIPLTSADGSASVRMLNCSAASGSSGRAPASSSSSAPDGSCSQLASSSAVGATMPCRSTSGSSPFSPASTDERHAISTWTALSAAPPYIPEWRSRSPVVTLRSKPIKPRVARLKAGTSMRDHPAVEDDPRVGAGLVLLDPVDDRRAADLLLAVEREAEIDRQRVASTRRCAALSMMKSWPLSSVMPRA